MNHCADMTFVLSLKSFLQKSSDFIESEVTSLTTFLATFLARFLASEIAGIISPSRNGVMNNNNTNNNNKNTKDKNRKDAFKQNNKNKNENQCKDNNTTFFFRTISFCNKTATHSPQHSWRHMNTMDCNTSNCAARSYAPNTCCSFQGR